MTTKKFCISLSGEYVDFLDKTGIKPSFLMKKAIDEMIKEGKTMNLSKEDNS